MTLPAATATEPLLEHDVCVVPAMAHDIAVVIVDPLSTLTFTVQVALLPAAPSAIANTEVTCPAGRPAAPASLPQLKAKLATPAVGQVPGLAFILCCTLMHWPVVAAFASVSLSNHSVQSTAGPLGPLLRGKQPLRVCPCLLAAFRIDRVETRVVTDRFPREAQFASLATGSGAIELVDAGKGNVLLSVVEDLLTRAAQLSGLAALSTGTFYRERAARSKSRVRRSAIRVAPRRNAPRFSPLDAACG